jgi:GDP-L-fucose synthase
MFNTNMIKASFEANVDWFVYMSSVGVYAPADVMHEDSVWNTMPSKNDWHPGWAKRIGELTLDSLKIQYNWKNWSVIRPSNIYGLYDNFSENATVIAANTWKVFNTTSDKIICWGDGSAKRDFVFSEDVAQSVIDVTEKEVNDVINFGSANAVTIKETIETIVKNYQTITDISLKIEWDSSKPNGDLLRCLGSKKQEHYGILPKTSLNNGIMKTLTHYKQFRKHHE